MWTRLTAGLLLAVLARPAFAQVSPCETLSAAVDDQIKKAASTFAEGITDNSAPRATMRELQIANSLSLVRINLDLMVQNKCPARKSPVDPMIYLSDALACEVALQKGDKEPAACKRDTWQSPHAATASPKP